MIKAIEGHKVKPSADIQNIQDVFLKLRGNAMQYPGFVSAENLVGAQDDSIVVFVSTWDAVENWLAWEISNIRIELNQQIEDMLVEDTKVTIYRIVPTQWG